LYKQRKTKVFLNDITNFLNYKSFTENFEINSPSTIENVKNNSILFYTQVINPKFNLSDKNSYDIKNLEKFNNILLITDSEFQQELNFPIIISKNPRLDFQRIIIKFFSDDQFNSGIHPNSTIESETNLGKNVYIGPNCYIGKDVTIGDNTKILSNTVIFGITKIGSNCVISSNSTIGSEGFSFTFDKDSFVHFNHLGKILIGDHVWIGSNCTIERSQIDETIIEEHVKIDDLVHISHNVHIKKFSQITVGSKILGRSKIGEHCWISPNCIIENGYEIGDHSIVGTSSLVRNNFPSNSVIFGTPAKLIRSNK